MNDGVKLLLERIKTHPEEFVTNVYSGRDGLFSSTRWLTLVQHYENFLNPEDRQTLRDAMNAVMAEKFTEAVMKELMGAEDDDPLGKSQKAHSGTVLGGLTQGISSSPYQQVALSSQMQQTQMQQALLAQSTITTGSGLGGAGATGTVTLSGAGTGSSWVGQNNKSAWQNFKGWLGL